MGRLSGKTAIIKQFESIWRCEEKTDYKVVLFDFGEKIDITVVANC